MTLSTLLILVVAGGCAFLYGLHGGIRALRKHERITFFDLLLVCMVALLALTAVVIDNQDNTLFGTAELISTLLGAGFIVLGVLLALLELRRPTRLKQSRGMLSMGTGVLLIIMTFITFLTAQAELQIELATLPTPTAGTTQTPQELGEALFTDILDLIANETGGLPQQVILEQLDSGVTLRQLIADNGGNVETVVDSLTAMLVDFIKRLASEGRIETSQATAVIGSMGIFVRLSLDRDFSGFLVQITQTQPTPNPSQITAQTQPATITHIPATHTNTPQPTQSNTAMPTRTPITLATSAPLSTFLMTPTNTPDMANPTPSRTPTFAPTSAIPCLVVMNYNVNLRETPDTDGRILITIPFETTVFGIGRTADAQWWQVEYENRRGWVFNDVVTITSTCRQLSPAEG